MPISQAISWYLVLRPQGSHALMDQVWKVASFYGVWALYNRFIQGVRMEMAYITMGLLAWAAHSHSQRGSIAGTVLVLLNYLMAFGIIVSYSAHDMAEKGKKRTDKLALTWAHTFKAYVCSNLAMWGLVLVRLIQQPNPLRSMLHAD